MHCHFVSTQLAQNELCSSNAHVSCGDVDRRQRRVGVHRELEIVEADDGNVAGNFQSPRAALDERPQRQNVVAADNGGGLRCVT